MYIAIQVGNMSLAYQVFSATECADLLVRRALILDPTHNKIVTWHQAAIS